VIPDPFENTDVFTMNLGSIGKFYRRQEIWTIIFMKPGEQESLAWKDEYKTFAEKMFGIFGVGAINCAEDEELCEEFIVYSYPTVKIFTEKDSDDGTVYAGKRQW